MRTIEEKVSAHVRKMGVNLSKMSRDTKIPYVSLYNSLFNSESDRELRAKEYVAICKFLEKDPMGFVEKEG